MGVNRRFQAKSAKYSNFCIIKTTNAIATKFCTVIKTVKFSLLVVSKFAPQIQNGGQPQSLKNGQITIFHQQHDRFLRNFACWRTLAFRTLSNIPTRNTWQSLIARLAPQCRPLASSSETKPCYHLANLQRMHVISVCLHYGNIIWLPWQRLLTKWKIRYRSIIAT